MCERERTRCVLIESPQPKVKRPVPSVKFSGQNNRMYCTSIAHNRSSQLRLKGKSAISSSVPDEI